MPSLNPESFTVSYIPYCDVITSTKGFPPRALQALEANAVKANVILPMFLKAREEEKITGLPNPDNTWVVCYDSPDRTEVLYIASLTKGMMGNYPLFIFTAAARSALVEDEVDYAMAVIAEAIDASVPRSRIYSVFAVDVVSEAFSAAWTRRTGIECYTRPYYDSTISFCSKRDIIQSRQDTILPGIEYDLCPATWEDIPAVGRLCEMFAAESEPFVLTPNQGQEEALKLVSSNQVWVHRVRQDNGPSEIASIVAFTRNCHRVSTITKVYTPPNWRRRGCAERLMRRVCKNILYSTDPKESIALFVGNDNPAAKVYARIGFLGLDKSKGPVKDIDRWIEIGFDRRQVQMGQW